jgi:hypothetical protein
MWVCIQFFKNEWLFSLKIIGTILTMSKQKEVVEFYDLCTVENGILCTPVLYSLTKRGKIRIWHGYIAICEPFEVESGDKVGNWLEDLETLDPQEYKDRKGLPKGWIACHWTKYYQEGGKFNITKPSFITKGNNLTKANYTTPFTLAIHKMRSKYNKYIKGGSVTTKSSLLNPDSVTMEQILKRNDPHPHRVNVMLIHDFKKHHKKVKYPCILQDKMDGIHYTIVAHPKIPNGIDGFTRYRKSYGQKHLLRSAKKVLLKYPGLYLSGELVCEGGRSDISGKSRRDDNEDLEMWLFDCFYVDKVMGFNERWELCRKIWKQLDHKLFKLVDWTVADNEKDMKEWYDKKIKQDSEGIIIRNLDAPYEFGLSGFRRTHGALKYKPRYDSEYQIVGFTEGTGGNKGLIVWTLVTKSGKEFNASPKWSHERRAQVFKDQTREFTAKGKWATIEYDSLEGDMPIQPVFIRIRDKK